MGVSRASSPPEVAAGMTRGALVAELAQVVGAPHEARFIVDEALGLGLSLGQPNLPTGPLDPEVVARARELARRRAAGEPLQYLFGHWPFRTLDLLVDPRVLIPRPETEQVVEVALREVRSLSVEPVVAVDAGTGSGAIALSLAAELGPRAARGVWAVDASADALAVASSNLARVGRARALAPVTLVEGSWLEPLPAELAERVQLVVSNPPYVSVEEWAGLASDVRQEPRSALVAGPASDGTPGLADVEAVLAQALAWLARPGVVVVELAPHQAAAAQALARQMGYDEVQVEPDLARRPRLLVARRAG
jgi:release factor glutamine methyltransferase